MSVVTLLSGRERERGGERESKCKLSISKVDKLQAIVKSHNWAIEAPHIGAAAVAVEQKGASTVAVQCCSAALAACHMPLATCHTVRVLG